MTYAIDVLLDQPVLLLFVLAIGAAIGIGVEKLFNSIEREKRRAYWRGRKSRSNYTANSSPKKDTPASTTDTAADQLKRVMTASFKARPLLNKPERRLLSVIDQALAEHSPGWRAMGQVSLGEILWSDDKNAFWTINAKRVDLLIVDAEFKPIHAVEFQGNGHHISDEAAARDAVKKEALRRAGIGYAEVISGDTPAEIRQLILKLCSRDQ